MPNFFFDVVQESDQWPDEKALRKAVGRVAALVDDKAEGHATYVFSEDSLVQILNREWRGRDKPTNVLSFPDGDAGDSGKVHYGDVILAHETLVREAAELGISFDDHLTHLLLHGTLHLLGYDHENDQDAKTMENLETALLGQLGIKDPYDDASDAGQAVRGTLD